MIVLRRLMAGLLLLMLAAGPASAEVMLTLYAHGGNQVRGGWLLFPHAYVTLQGTLESTGEVIDRSAGFTARNPGPQLLFASGRGVVEAPDALYVADGRAYLSVPVSDEAYAAISERIAYWASREGGTYNLRRRNCIHFVAEIARLAGLRIGNENTLSPNGFMLETVELNPGAAIVMEPASAPEPGPR